MGEIKFSNNYSDLSQEHGARAGFQFEFHCQRCGDTWRSPFVAYKAGQAAEWLGRASGMLGGVLHSVTSAASGVSEATYGMQHDKEFTKAIDAMAENFNRCPRCANYYCDSCWNADAGLCLGCAPSAEVEIEAAYASGKVYAAGEKAALHGIREGKQMDVKERKQLVCPDCGAANEGAKFCPDCGTALSKKRFCTECGSEMAATAKFCGECGAKPE